MKIILLNGSPNKNGCTKRALMEVSSAITAQNIETEIIDIPRISYGCNGCGSCAKTHKCIINDGVNEIIEKVKAADGLVLGSPVYYASACGSFIAFLDRLFCASKGAFQYKVGASVVSARRAGTTSTFDELNKYFLLSNMVLAPSNYWNAVHGSTPSDVEKDIEGMQTMRILGKNIAWLVKNLSDTVKPLTEDKIKTNFIR